MRILVDITPEQQAALKTLAQKTGKPRAQVIRQALDSYITTYRDPLDSFFGSWADNRKTQDVQGFLDRQRDEWQR